MVGPDAAGTEDGGSGSLRASSNEAPEGVASLPRPSRPTPGEDPPDAAARERLVGRIEVHCGVEGPVEGDRERVRDPYEVGDRLLVHLPLRSEEPEDDPLDPGLLQGPDPICDTVSVPGPEVETPGPWADHGEHRHTLPSRVLDHRPHEPEPGREPPHVQPCAELQPIRAVPDRGSRLGDSRHARFQEDARHLVPPSGATPRPFVTGILPHGSSRLDRRSRGVTLFPAERARNTRRMESAPGPDPALTAGDIIRVLESRGVTHVAGIPDNSSAPLFAQLVKHRTISLVTVSREGEAFALAAGVWVGGGVPFVVVQNTGLLESGDAIRGTAVRMGVPLPFLVTGRGYAKLERAGLAPDAVGSPAASAHETGDEPDWPDLGLLRDPGVDSVALHTEPTLRAWGIPYLVDDGRRGTARLQRSFEAALRREHPHAHLLTRALV